MLDSKLEVHFRGLAIGRGLEGDSGVLVLVCFLIWVPVALA